MDLVISEHKIKIHYGVKKVLSTQMNIYSSYYDKKDSSKEFKDAASMPIINTKPLNRNDLGFMENFEQDSLSKKSNEKNFMPDLTKDILSRNDDEAGIHKEEHIQREDLEKLKMAVETEILAGRESGEKPKQTVSEESMSHKGETEKTATVVRKVPPVSHSVKPEQTKSKQGPSKTVKTVKPSIKTIMFWNSWFQWKDYRFGFGQAPFSKYCGTDKCQTTMDKGDFSKADAVIFFSHKLLLNVTRYTLPKRSHKNQIYVYFNQEPPPLIMGKTKMLGKDMNMTISYRDDSTIYWPYGEYIKRPKAMPYVPITQKQLATKIAPVAWLITKCGENKNVRWTYTRALMKHIKVNIYGSCGIECDYKKKNLKGCMDLIDTKHKFYLAFENSVCIEYITEKVFRTLRYNMVPIVMGGGNYTKVLPPNSFIDVRDYKSPKHLADHLKFLSTHEKYYLKYFEWKKDFIIRDIIPDTSLPLCKLCDMLHTQNQQYYKNFDVGQWWERNKCVTDREQLLNMFHVEESKD